MQIAVDISRGKSAMTEEDLAFQIAAVDVQLRDHFCPAWGIDYWPAQSYLELPKQADLYHPLFVMDDIELDGAAGYHDAILTYIYGRVVTPVDARDATVMSHEALELRGDPNCDLWAPMAGGRLTAWEACDAVQGDSYPIVASIAGRSRPIEVSNFVLPSYFVPGSQGPWDWMGRLLGPAPHMTPGGYIIARSPGSTNVEYIFADRGAARHASFRKADPHSRTARRTKKGTP